MLAPWLRISDLWNKAVQDIIIKFIGYLLLFIHCYPCTGTRCFIRHIKRLEPQLSNMPNFFSGVSLSECPNWDILNRLVQLDVQNLQRIRPIKLSQVSHQHLPLKTLAQGSAWKSLLCNSKLRIIGWKDLRDLPTFLYSFRFAIPKPRMTDRCLPASSWRAFLFNISVPPNGWMKIGNGFKLQRLIFITWTIERWQSLFLFSSTTHTFSLSNHFTVFVFGNYSIWIDLSLIVSIIIAGTDGILMCNVFY